MRRMERVWDRVFGIRYCPVNFWEAKTVRREARKSSVSHFGHCPKKLPFCCLYCRESQSCQAKLCCSLEDLCEVGIRDLPLEGLEKTYRESSSYAEFHLKIYKGRSVRIEP